MGHWDGGEEGRSRGAAHSNHNTGSENMSDDIFVAGTAFPMGEEGEAEVITWISVIHQASHIFLCDNISVLQRIIQMHAP